MSLIKNLASRKLIHPPNFLVDNTFYLTIMGSEAYGIESGESDRDVYGFCIPPKYVVFPHLTGEIPGFGTQIKRFEQYQEHHVVSGEARGNKGIMYDISVYSIVKYFQLCMENNPNMIDSLFTPQTCVLHSTNISNMVRDNRKIFLHKGCWHKFKGYAYSQVHKMKSKNPEGKRVAIVEKFGYDVKFAYHEIRLLNEVEQILTEGDIDLQRNREQLKSIRRGEWEEDDIVRYFESKEKELEYVYTNSKLPYGPDEAKIKELLLQCLEHHFGSISNCVVIPDASSKALNEIKHVLERYGI